MKRKIIPFPSSAICSTGASEKPISVPLKVIRPHDLPLAVLEEKVPLCQHHAFSLILLTSEELQHFSSTHSIKLVVPRLLRPGLVEVVIRSGSDEGYGARSWPFRIGGFGLIHDEFEAPLAVRCAIPIAHSHIDDSGFVDAAFWRDSNSDISHNPTLQEIITRLITIMSAAYYDALEGERHRYWKDSEIHCHQKVAVIEKYRQLALYPALVHSEGIISSDMLSPDLRDLPIAEWIKTIDEISPGVFSLDLFSSEFCDRLIAEVDNFEATSLPRRRPNTMNKFGLILNEIGMEPIMSHLLSSYLAPLCEMLYPHENVAVGLDHHHTFVVVYSQSGDKGLDMHHDASEVTVNVCLGREFSGSGLIFCGEAGKTDHRKKRHTYSHAKGRAVIHLGRQRHGADGITSGERMNLIMWARSSAFRCAAVNGIVSPDGYPRLTEDGTPDKVCLSMTNDDDYALQLRSIATLPT